MSATARGNSSKQRKVWRQQFCEGRVIWMDERESDLDIDALVHLPAVRAPRMRQDRL